MKLDDIKALPVADIADEKHICICGCPMRFFRRAGSHGCMGFEYKGNIVWEKVRKDGGPDGRGVGFYFRNVTELILFGIKKRAHQIEPFRLQGLKLI